MKRKGIDAETAGEGEGVEGAEVGWACLPWVPLLETLAQLSQPSELARVGLVCRAWQAAACDNRLWRHLCLRDWRIRRPLGASQENSAGVNFKDLYAEMVREHGEYRAFYAHASDMWAGYEAWLADHSPLITLQPAAPSEGVRLLENTLGAGLPLDMKCALRIRNGQNLKGERVPGLLGGYSFYEHRVDMQLLGTNEMRLFTDSIARHVRADPQFPRWLVKVCPIARSKSMGKILFVLLEDLEGHGSRGNVVATSEDYKHTFKVGASYTSFLSEHLDKLLRGAYQVSEEGEISLFPLPGARGVGVATTQGITVEAAPLFIPEKSNLTSNPPSYFWAYRIRMRMPADCSARSSQLEARHWAITDGDGRTQEVRGRGVIGLFPVMEPGASFEYESCCPLSTPHGTMKGSFVMEYKDSHDEFEVVVPEFEFFLPPGSRPNAS